ncbi:MAG: DUF2490 domain-containing protein [Cyclobacteriaceae bacterium]
MIKRHGFSTTLIGLGLTLISSLALGQAASLSQREIVDQMVAWTSYSGNLTIAKGTTLFVDGHFRYAQSEQSITGLEPMQVLLRSHLEFKIKGKLTFSPFGYAYIHNYQYGKQPVSIINHERRIYQQLAFSYNWGKTSIGHRLRTEERFIEEHDASGESTGFSNKQFRVRYRFMATRPIGKEKLEPHTFFTQAFYEGFISRGKKVTFDDIDQNRLFVGVGYQPIKGLNLSVGPFYQMLVKANGVKQENNIGMMFMVTQNIDLTAKNQ